MNTLVHVLVYGGAITVFGLYFRKRWSAINARYKAEGEASYVVRILKGDGQGLDAGCVIAFVTDDPKMKAAIEGGLPVILNGELQGVVVQLEERS